MDLSLARRRSLRKCATDAEALLWRLLLGRTLSYLKFRRQHTIAPFILDFYCPDRRIGIELDGGQHFSDEGKRHDESRTAYLAKQGIRVLRFSNRELFEETDAVLDIIKRACSR